MAIYGLQTDFMNQLLRAYFGFEVPDGLQREIYIGLGLTQQGAAINTENFDEVFAGRPLGNYKRARAVFNRAINNIIVNENEIVFNTAEEDWTDQNHKIEMLGLFDTLDYENELHELVKPLVVLRLPRYETVLKGETLLLAPGAIELSLTDL